MENRDHSEIFMRVGRFVIYTLILTFSAQSLFAHEMLISGVYLGKNLYVQNPSCSEQSGFSIKYVYVNGNLKVENPTTSTFELDLSGFAVNTHLEIKIIYGESCAPQLINPQVIKPKDNFNFQRIAALNDSLTWETTGEKGIHKFLVEKRTSNDWLIIQACDGQGFTRNLYSIKLNPTSGVNVFRLKYIDGNGRSWYSPAINYNAEKDAIESGTERFSNKE